MKKNRVEVINQKLYSFYYSRPFDCAKDVAEMILLISFLFGMKCSETTSPPTEQHTYLIPVASYSAFKNLKEQTLAVLLLIPLLVLVILIFLCAEAIALALE